MARTALTFANIEDEAGDIFLRGKDYDPGDAPIPLHDFEEAAEAIAERGGHPHSRAQIKRLAEEAHTKYLRRTDNLAGGRSQADVEVEKILAAYKEGGRDAAARKFREIAEGKKHFEVVVLKDMARKAMEEHDAGRSGNRREVSTGACRARNGRFKRCR